MLLSNLFVSAITSDDNTL